MEKETALQRQLRQFLTERSEALQAAKHELESLMTFYRCAMLEVETKFKVLNAQFSLQHERNPIEGIKTRLKSLDSIQEKLQRKGHPLSTESIEQNLFDVAGVRVICGFLDDIYMLADCLLRQDDVILLEQKDYIKKPKKNGYRSLHLLVQVPIFLHDRKKLVAVEVQLRTIAMESWANLEHRLRYKKELDEALLHMTEDELSACAELSSQLDQKMQKVRDILEG